MKLVPFDSGDAAKVRELFADSLYDEAHLIEIAPSGVPPVLIGEYEQEGRYAEVLAGDSAFDVLMRCFFLGLSVPGEMAKSALSEWFVRLLLDHGVMHEQESVLWPTLLLVPCEGLWVASDLHQQRQSKSLDDHILPVNRPARHLCNFLIRQPVRRGLDLCSGNALHALLLDKFCDQVTSTDLSPRAEAYCQFNVALNGCSPIESLKGDLFEPVGERTFDRIVCNPPFVVTPVGEAKFQANTLELDEFCRKLVQSIPGHLADGGYCQMLCEWVQVEGQAWEERLTEWMIDLGCDVWIMLANTQFPVSYTRTRCRDAGLSEVQLARREKAWLEYFDHHRVKAIHGGVLTLRRRVEGPNWVRIDELIDNVAKPVGDDIVQIFTAEDFLQTHGTDEEMLDSLLRVSSSVHLDHESVWSGDDWESVSAILRTDHGLTAPLQVDKMICELVSLCKGRDSLRTVLSKFAATIGADPVSMRSEGIGIVKNLIRRGILKA